MTTQIKVPIVVNMNMDEIIDRLKEDDFVQVVRCKDCKYYRRNDRRSFIRGSDCSKEIIDTIVPDRDFCSKAERKEE